MCKRRSHLLLLFTLLLPLNGAPPGSQEPVGDLPLPTVVYLSLPACVSAVLENPERTEELFRTNSYPRNLILYQLEKEIEKELKAVGNATAAEAIRLRKQQNLVSKVEFLYLKANSEPSVMRALLKLNGLAEDLPARADDNVYEILFSRLWMPDQALESNAIRRRPETRVRNRIIEFLIRIQLNLALALCESSSNTIEAKTAALIELSNIAAIPPPEIDCGNIRTPVAGKSEPVYQKTSFPILDLYSDLFHVTDWSPF